MDGWGGGAEMRGSGPERDERGMQEEIQGESLKIRLFEGWYGNLTQYNLPKTYTLMKAI